MPHHSGHEHPRPGPTASPATTRRALKVGLALTGGFAVVEAVGGWLAGSLALISDAGHMVTDAASFVVALIAASLARRPPTRRASYGYARAEVIAAFVNALAMLALIVWIAVEAVRRLLAPAPVAGTTVMVVAAVGIVNNLVGAWTLARESSSINARGALLHVVGDNLQRMIKLYMDTVASAGTLVPVTKPFPITSDCQSVTVDLAVPQSGLYVVCRMTKEPS